MCGIAGIISRQNIDFTEDLKKILKKIKYRGPDESGIKSFKNLSIGMNRLSIIDSNKHNIPYFDNEKKIWAVFNGEIYNFKQLKKEFNIKNDFRTFSDIEIIIFLYKKFGLKFIHKINGMFSIAIYDKEKNKIFLFRDRAGEKPLYYYFDKNIFIFASEIKALLNHSGSKINENYFPFRSLEISFGENTMFDNIYSLLPGDYLVLNTLNLSFKKYSYWKAWDNKLDLTNLSDERLADELSDLLIDAIKLRSENTNKLTGCFVSGGIDSSIVASILKPDYLYTIFFDLGPDFDELNYAKMIAKHIKRDLNIISPKPSDFNKTRKKIAYHLDTPCTWTSFSIWKLLERCSKDVKVILSGDGADEIFAGYHRYLLLYHDQQIFNIPSLKNYNYLINNYYGDAKDRYTRLINRNYNKFDEKNNKELYKFVEYNFNKTNSVINAMTMTDFYSTMQVLLQMSDRLTSAFSIENRSPFLDHRIIEFGFSINDNMKIRDGKTKWLLKEVSKRFVPKKIYERIDKRGFSAPLNKWFGWDKLGSGKYQRETYKNIVYNDWEKIFIKK